MRKKRVWYKGAIYHLINRGVNKQDIYIDETDYNMFIHFLKKTIQKYNVMLHSYCLMKNHYHLLLETKDEEIWKIMKEIGQYYTMYFNNRHGRDGPLFRGRYYASIIENDIYFLEAIRYIPLNPIRAGLVTRPEEYRWSSYEAYFTKNENEITYIEKTLKYFKNEMEYRKFIEDGIEKEKEGS